MTEIDYLLRAGVVAFSLLAAWFWMAAAWGSNVWRASEKVPADQLVAHQARWNSSASLCAGIAAACQGFLWLQQNLPQSGASSECPLAASRRPGLSKKRTRVLS
jgi:hypothetical protein